MVRNTRFYLQYQLQGTIGYSLGVFLATVIATEPLRRPPHHWPRRSTGSARLGGRLRALSSRWYATGALGFIPSCVDSLELRDLSSRWSAAGALGFIPSCVDSLELLFRAVKSEATNMMVMVATNMMVMVVSERFEQASC